MSDIVLTKNLEDKNLSKRQYNRARSFVALTVPSLTSQLPEVDFKKSRKVTNGFYRFRLAIHPEAFGVIGKTTAQDLYNRLMTLIQADPFSYEINAFHARSYNENTSNERTQTPQEKLAQDATDVASKLMIILDAQAPMADKYKAYGELREIELFEELGPALIIGLIPADQLENVLFVRVAIRQPGMPQRRTWFLIAMEQIDRASPGGRGAGS